MLLDILQILFHAASIVTGLVAGILWMKSANVNMPAISPDIQLRDPNGSLSPDWLNDVAKNLDQHKKAFVQSAHYNKGAATSAAVAALSQAANYGINLITDIIQF